jgi:hypothetical protein
VTGWWFSPGPLVSSTNKTDRRDITEILLKMALNSTKKPLICLCRKSQKKRMTMTHFVLNVVEMKVLYPVLNVNQPII